MSAEPLIQLKKVTKNYRIGDETVRALAGVDLEVAEGEFVALVGPSGSGKSTMLHIIGGLDSPSSGEVIVAGRNLSQASDNQLSSYRNRSVGFVFQTFNLLSRYTAQQNVALPMIYIGEGDKNRKEKSLKVLKMVGLEKRATHKPNELSGGERQRVAIARALVNDANIILADEPTGNLDSKSGNEIMDIIASLNKKEGKTIILVTHENEIAKYDQRKISMIDGKIISDASIK